MAAASNGDIYIADTLNYRVRMIDHATGLHSHRRRNGVPGDERTGRRRRTGRERPPQHAERRRDRARTATSTSPTCTISGCAVSTPGRAASTTVAGNGRWGYSGDDGPATEAVARRSGGYRRGARADGTRDDLHRGLLQRPRPRGRSRRHHPRRQRRRAGALRRADPRRLRAASAAGCTSPTRAATASSS